MVYRNSEPLRFGPKSLKGSMSWKTNIIKVFLQSVRVNVTDMNFNTSVKRICPHPENTRSHIWKIKGKFYRCLEMIYSTVGWSALRMVSNQSTKYFMKVGSETTNNTDYPWGYLSVVENINSNILMNCTFTFTFWSSQLKKSACVYFLLLFSSTIKSKLWLWLSNQRIFSTRQSR